MSTDILETERLILRRPNGGDWEAARDFFMSDRAAGIGGPYTLGKAWRQFAAEIGHWDIFGFGMWAVTLKGDDRILGLVGPWCPADWPEREIGWFVFGDAEGKGIAAEAARAAIDHAFDVLGWDTLVHYVGQDNPRSAALAERMGAVLDMDATQPYADETCHIYRSTNPTLEGLQGSTPKGSAHV